MAYNWTTLALVLLVFATIGCLIMYLARVSLLIILLVASCVSGAIANMVATMEYRDTEFASPYEIIDPVPGVFWFVSGNAALLSGSLDCY